MTVTLAGSMLETHPAEIPLERETLAATIDSLVICSQVCTACADACLSEPSVADLRQCIGTNLDCADICAVAARVLSRHNGFDVELSRGLVASCLVACKACGDECESHASMHEHCRICAEACRACQRMCQELLAAIG